MRPFRLTPIALLLLASTTQAEGIATPLKLDSNLVLNPPRDEPAGVWHLSADKVEGNPQTQLNAWGHVQLRRRGALISADSMCYRASPEQIEAEGNVRAEQRGDIIWGDQMQLRQDNATGYANNARYQLGLGARGTARRLLMEGEKRYSAETGSFTTCAPGNEDWVFRSDKLDLDYNRNVGEAHHTTLQFLGVPVLYWPWMDFSLNGQRKSGFLPPMQGSSNTGGFELTLPFYWNIAPNYDAEIAPRFIARRGVALNTEFRYLQPSFTGTLKSELLNNDRLTSTRRSFVSFQHQHKLLDNLTANINLQKASDDNYFVDLSSKVSSTSQGILPREGSLTYSQSGWIAQARVQRYQTLRDEKQNRLVAPYAQVPQLQLNRQGYDGFGTNYNFKGEYTQFDHPTQVSGKRLVINPSISTTLNTTYAYITPKLGLHYTQYNIDRFTPTDSPAYNHRRTLPIFSTDAGIVLEREGSWLGNEYIQTLEPRMFYVRIPYREQSQLPLFDTALRDFNYASMFSENQFSGADRINDANQVTAAVTTRFLEAGSGRERMRLGVGQRFYRSPQQVTLTPQAIETGRARNSSDIITFGGGQITNSLDVDATWQYNSSIHKTQRIDYNIRYQPAIGKALNLGYRMNRDALPGIVGQRQIDFSTQWPMSSRWSGVTRVAYSLKDRKNIESLAGVEYNAGCWVLRLVGQRFVTTSNQTSSNIFLQVELSDVARIGTNPLELLARTIPGYSKLNASPQPLQSDAYK
ncbi:LPS-assembly protein [Chitinivorax tropicus]|uniref:LPS-assembly protein LptD n=1 Tax=Chitinivorax tropicus TaxID=714531 RepID=A0A840MDB1_9PROT|nr:LPS-assembly protein LptD [Chitinivorax tropicus]MBB5017294.1 LPS-assembly protein [Chitinivorax tropicus]